MDPALIREGMVVRTSDGHKLGKIIQCDSGSFIIEKGFFFPKEYVCDFAQVADVRNGEVWLFKTKDQLAGAREERRGERVEGREEMRIPLAEEELEATKHVREGGALKIHKDVETVQKEISVPVMRETAHVERVPASEKTAERPGAASFKEETVSIPLREEEVEIRKRPVVREELRVRKDRQVEERRATETVRRETADVDEKGEVIKTPEPKGPTRY